MFPIDPGCSGEMGVLLCELGRDVRRRRKHKSSVWENFPLPGSFNPAYVNYARGCVSYFVSQVSLIRTCPLFQVPRSLEALFASGDESCRSHNYEIKWKPSTRPTWSGSSNYFKICLRLCLYNTKRNCIFIQRNDRHSLFFVLLLRPP